MKCKSHTSFSVVLVGLLIVLNIGCSKETDFKKDWEAAATYILSPVDSIEPTRSDYFVRMEFPNSELYYSTNDSNVKLLQSYSSGYGNMIGRGYAFVRNMAQARGGQDEISIMFYIHEGGDPFVFQHANYQYGNPWNSVPGANVEYSTPADRPSSFYLYLGTNTENAYFEITWYDQNRICGQFQTQLVGCCGSEETFWVKGEFSIPMINQY
jgi:hypothetical protein